VCHNYVVRMISLRFVVDNGEQLAVSMQGVRPCLGGGGFRSRVIITGRSRPPLIADENLRNDGLCAW